MPVQGQYPAGLDTAAGRVDFSELSGGENRHKRVRHDVLNSVLLDAVRESIYDGDYTV